jgi:lysophospholipase L1-like esterase
MNRERVAMSGEAPPPAGRAGAGASRARGIVVRLVAVALSILFPLGVVEIGYRLTRKPPKPRSPPMAVFCGSCSYIFELNPARPDVSKQKLRDRDFSPTPAEGVYRIMVLGDSLPYGTHVASKETFPRVLEARLGGEAAHVEVVNAGVIAYTAYNERQFYESHARELHPSLVVISFCMNDVVDPVLHWAKLVAGNFALDRLTPAAIPDPAYHQAHALPQFRKERSAEPSAFKRLLGRSELYKRAVAPLLVPGMPDTHVTSGGKTFPSYLTGEDGLGMDVLMDYESIQWVWLRQQYDAMLEAIRKDGVKVAILVNPLQYQLMEGYPLFPQRLFDRYCKEHGVACLDVLPALKAHGGEKLFFGKRDGEVDIWHYTPEGHAVVGEALAEFLAREGLLPPRAQ